MKYLNILSMSLLLGACGEGQIEEFAFRKAMELTLVDLCGDEDKECIAAVESQTGVCMKKSNWRKYVASEDDQAELNRFTTEFYSCIVDKDGNSYFVHDEE
ncbi:MAG: hypothetical protein CME36_12055 [unclassified Hahellaceae]|nr:hypothetical protein [Hahellaceae bacterium]|tara:strand:+ start:2682 stop:2984 length:303 start_codon:yes stop_codon:yes gene_type:complete